VKEKSFDVDILINNAGYAVSGNFKDTNIRKEENMLTLNILTLTKLTHFFLQDMLLRKSGHIVNIASTGAFQGVPGFSVYAASKAYVLHFTEAIAEELKTADINITAICPGVTQSEFAQTANVSDAEVYKKAPGAKELAEFIYNSVQKKKTTAVHGLKTGP